MVSTALAILLYFAATGLLLRHAGHSTGPHRRLALGCALLAALLHGWGHVPGLARSGADLHFFAALSLVALGMVVLTTLAALRQRIEALGLVVYPLAAVFLAFYASSQGGEASAMDWRIALHAWLALLAYATLAIASLLALALWVQERSLRGHRASRFSRFLPPLMQLEALLFRCISAGFVLLSAALLTGVLFVHDMLAQHLWHKTVFSILSWMVFGGLLFGRFRYGWRGARAVRYTLIAMALLLVAFFGSKFVLELVLQRG